MSIVGFFAPVDRTAVTATQLTLTLSASSGLTGLPVTVTVTPNGQLASTVNVLLFVSGGGSLALSGFTFTAGTSAAQSTTLTRSTDGTSTLTMSNDGGLGNAGTPASYVSTSSTFSVGNAYIVLAGQSNAHGVGLTADISASPLSSDPGLATYAASTFSRVKIWTDSVNKWQSLLLGTNNGGVNPPPGSGAQFGPEFGLAVRWMRETTSGTLYIIKDGASGASITAFERGVGFNQYLITNDAVTLGNNALSASGVTISQKAFVWVQGESDYAQTQSWYQTKLQDLLNGAYTDGWFTATDKQILFQVGTTSTLYGADVAAAKVAVAAADTTNIKTPASPNYWAPDGYHQNARGQVQMGYDAFQLIFNRASISV